MPQATCLWVAGMASLLALGLATPAAGTATPETQRPSRLYRAEVWRVGLWVVRWIPAGLLQAAARSLAALYWKLFQNRRQVVIENLAPLCDGHRPAAVAAARRLYRNFALKLVDLWRYEAGLDIQSAFGHLRGAEQFLGAVAQKRGILLVTPHLGNWEFGAPLLSRLGIKLLALTLAEPHEPLTDLRRAARARHGIETLVIQQDPFAFLEVIRRLERGEVVALLIDRPPKPVAARVEFCGRAIDASIAPAELARASGCMILPVFLHRSSEGRYDAQVLPEVTYDRAALRAPQARRDLAQAILATFEPAIREHADQWYHFVPLWSPPDAAP